jgi:hypothetical protein
MGADLVPLVENFIIESKTFAAGDCAVVEGCAEVGTRKLLRFDFLCWNPGDTAAHLGSPAANPQWFVWSPCHGHWHIKDFNDYRLLDCEGQVRVGRKQAFCLEDFRHIAGGPASAHFTCGDQGVSPGWADVYEAGLDCQWIDITGLPDGDYVLEAETNRSGIVHEDHYGNNFVWAGVRIAGGTATGIAPPCYPEDCLPINPSAVEAKQFGSRWKVVEGSHWILDFGANKANAQKAKDIIQHYGMNRICYVGRPDPTNQQLMMYLTVNGASPTGVFGGEDAIPFNLAKVTAEQSGGSWIVTDTASIMLNFGISEANARRAVWIIKKYGFTHQCFVGRPHAPMMYFRK